MIQKIVVPFLFFNLFFNCCFAQLQTTWVKTLYYQPYPGTGQTNDSLLVGPKEIVLAADGTFFVLNNNCPGYSQSIYHVDSLGSILSSIGVGNMTSSTQRSASNLYATSDSGYMYLDSYAATGLPEFNLYKVSKNGIRSTVHSWTNYGSGPFSWLNKVIPNHHNGYYCNINDTFIDIPSNNIILDNIISVFDNDDYLTQDTMLSRKDLAGNIIWTLPISGVIANSETSIYVKTDSLIKVDAMNGTKLWTKQFQAASQYNIMHSTDGLITRNGRMIILYDSTGMETYSNTIQLTYRIPRTIASGNDGSIYTGGSFINYTGSTFPTRNYSSFLIKLNEEVQGVVDSTAFYRAGDANNDSDVKFVKDGLFIAAALGQSTNLIQLNENTSPTWTTYSELWPQETTCGINYRSSDATMDGVINSDDIDFLDNHFCYYASSENDTSGFTVRVVYDNNILVPGDTLKASIILGSPSNPTDSIYGFSIEPLAPFMYYGRSLIVDYKNGVLGDTATNLSIFLNDTTTSNTYRGLITCRNDHQNVSISGDTLFRITTTLPPFMQTGTYMFPSACFMIKENGCFVPVNVISDTLNIVVTSVNNLNQNNSLNIFPNPANNKVTIVSENNSIEYISIKDLSGKILYQKSIIDELYNFSTETLTNEFYIIETISNNTSKFNKLVISHQ